MDVPSLRSLGTLTGLFVSGGLAKAILDRALASRHEKRTTLREAYERYIVTAKDYVACGRTFVRVCSLVDQQGRAVRELQLDTTLDDISRFVRRSEERQPKSKRAIRALEKEWAAAEDTFREHERRVYTLGGEVKTLDAMVETLMRDWPAAIKALRDQAVTLQLRESNRARLEAVEDVLCERPGLESRSEADLEKFSKELDEYVGRIAKLMRLARAVLAK